MTAPEKSIAVPPFESLSNDRDFMTAHEIVSKSPNEEIVFAGVIVPCRRAEYLA
jgi:hypothetical protein